MFFDSPAPVENPQSERTVQMWIEIAEGLAKMPRATIDRMFLEIRAKKGRVTLFDVTEYLLSSTWRRFGYNVFELTEALTANILLNDPLRQIERIKFPYDAFVIQVPPGWLTFQGKVISYLMVGGLDPEMVKEELSRWGRVLDQPEDGQGDLIIAVLCSPAKWTNEAGDMLYCPLSKLVQHVYEGTTAEQKRIWRIVVGFMLYIQARPKDKQPSRNQSKKKRSQRGAWPTRWEVGRRLTMSTNLIDAGKDPSSHRPTPELERTWRLKYPHVVIGHSKTQRFGIGRQQVKTIWIDAYHRGPGGTGQGRAYVFED